MIHSVHIHGPDHDRMVTIRLRMKLPTAAPSKVHACFRVEDPGAGPPSLVAPGLLSKNEKG